MAYYLVIILFLVSLGGIFYIVKTKIAGLSNLPEKPAIAHIKSQRQSMVANVVNKVKEVRYTKYKITIFSWLERVLRRLRVWLLKVDGFFAGRMNKMKERSHVFNIRAKAWFVKKHIEDVQQQGEIEALVNGDKEELDVVEKEKILAPDQEKELLSQVVKNPKSPALYKKLADFYADKGNIEDAKSALLEVIKLRPTDAEALEKLEELEKD